MDPQRGGVVTSLRNKAYPADWIAAAHSETKTKSGTFSDTGFGGWYEMFPSIIGDLSSDHGEVWQIPWEVRKSDALGAELEVTAPSSGLKLRREIRLHSVLPEASVTYSLQNLGNSPYEYLWAWHPLFVLNEDTSLEVEGVRGWLQVYPLTKGLESLSQDSFLGVQKGKGAKWWSQKDDHFESICLKSESQGVLTVRPSHNLKHIGIWVDHQQFSENPTIAVEPAIGWFDDLAIALENGTAGIVPGKKSHSWSLLLSLG